MPRQMVDLAPAPTGEPPISEAGAALLGAIGLGGAQEGPADVTEGGSRTPASVADESQFNSAF